MSAAHPRSATRPRSPQRTDLKVVRRRKSKGLIKRTGARRWAPLTIVATIAIVGIVAAILLEQVVLAQSAFELTEIRRQLTAAEEDREVLMLEAAKLDSEARIERYARETLGMVDPAPARVRYIVADIPAARDPGVLATAIDRYGRSARAAAPGAAIGVAESP